MNSYFNNFKFFSNNQPLYRKPTFNELYNSLISEHVISEYVFESDLFQSLYNYIKENKNKPIHLFTTQKLLEFFNPKTKIFKVLQKNKNLNNYQLYVVVSDKSQEHIQNVIKLICADFNENPLDNEDIEAIYDLFKFADGLFTPLIHSTEFGILWLSDTANLTTFTHEFIHYIEWISGIYGKNIKINLDDNCEYFKGQAEFLKLFKGDETDLQYIFNKYEYQTLLNEFLDLLSKIYKNLDDNISEYEFAKDVNYYLFNDCSDVLTYLNKVKTFKYFKELNKNSFGLMMVVGYNCLKYKQMNIKNHIFGRFKNKHGIK